MTAINQKEYLKKYLSLGSEPGKKKKRKKKPGATSDRIKIIDDDIDIIAFNEAVEEDLHGLNEDAPQIVGVIDERPLELRISDYRNSDLWKPFRSDNNSTGISDNDNSIMEQNELSAKIQEPLKKIIHNIHFLDKNDDYNPSKQRSSYGNNDNSPMRPSHIHSDVKKITENNGNSSLSKSSSAGSFKESRRDSDISPNRKTIVDIDMSPFRKNRKDNDTDSGRKSKIKRDISPPRRNKRDNDISPPRKNRKDNYFSPVRKYETENYSSSKQKRCNNDIRMKNGEDIEKNRSKTNKDYDRYKSQRNDKGSKKGSSPRRFNADKDLSPNRSRNEKREKSTFAKSIATSSSDTCRKSRWSEDVQENNVSEDAEVSKRFERRKSGLQRANELMKESEIFNRKENQFVKDMAGFSGGNATPIVRDRKTGKIRDFKQEEEEARKKQEKEDELKTKYDRWGRGLKQVEDATEKLTSDLHEMSKPLARYADDEDLEKHLKELEREGDPMLQYLRKKRKKNDIESGKPIKLQFEGEFMPNRYGIRPGHRWDGVDRSNGYEKKWFEVMNSRRAQQEDAYKWSTEDM